MCRLSRNSKKSSGGGERNSGSNLFFHGCSSHPIASCVPRAGFRSECRPLLQTAPQTTVNTHRIIFRPARRLRREDKAPELFWVGRSPASGRSFPRGARTISSRSLQRGLPALGRVSLAPSLPKKCGKGCFASCMIRFFRGVPIGARRHRFFFCLPHVFFRTMSCL